jgi:DNA polymerase-3 subunit delta'
MNPFFDEIPGQQKAKEILERFLTASKVPHALLFSGIDGVGKEFLAINFAKSLVDHSLKKSSADKIISQIGNLAEPFVKYIFPLPRGKNETDNSSPTEKLTTDELEVLREQLALKIKNPYHKVSIPKANNIKINSIRDIKRFLVLDYSDVTKRFIIIDEAHLMNEEAQNALLKNLEEPPENIIFILCTSQDFRLRPTIVSRCWQINFDPLSEEDLAQILKKYYNISEDVIEAVTPFAEGSMQTALQLIGMDIFKFKEKTISILRYAFGRKFNSAFEEINKLWDEQTIQGFNTLIKMILTWLGDLQKHRFNLNQFFFKDYRETLDKFNSKFPNADLNLISRNLDRLSALTKNNINPALLTASLVFELSSLTSKN